MSVIQRPAIRLRLRSERPWREHERLYMDLFADPAVAAALWPGALGGPRTAEQAREMLNEDIAHWREERFGPWVFFEASTGLFVGRGGLRRARLGDEECVELLYALRPDVWGRGMQLRSHACPSRTRESWGSAMWSGSRRPRTSRRGGCSRRRVCASGAIRSSMLDLPHLLGRLIPNI